MAFTFFRIGCQDVGTPVWESSGNDIRSFPICIVNTCGHGLCDGQLQKPIITRLCCQWTALVYDHVYRAAMMEKSSVPRMQTPQVMCGKTRMEFSTASSSRRRGTG